MSNLLKTAVYTAICCVAAGATAQAQFFSSSSYYFNYNTELTSDSEPDYEMEFDSETGTLTILGTNDDDICTVDMLSYYYFSVSLETVTGTTTITQETMSFHVSELKTIVFEGGDGDDTFDFTDYALYRMDLFQRFSSYFNFDLSCDLRGGQGFDVLSGGVGSDILDGGDDDLEDILTGRAGADIFVHQRDAYSIFDLYADDEDKISTFSSNEEYELIIDLNETEGDMWMFDDELEKLLNPKLQKRSKSPTDDSTTTTSTYKF